MFKKTTQLLVAALATAAFAGTAGAASILWVTADDSVDASWLPLLNGAGHTVTSYTGSDNLALSTEIDLVNSFDVVIVDQSQFGTAPAARDKWNAITAPMILANYYLAGDQFGGWGYVTSNSSNVQGNPANLNVDDATDAIWTGIDTTGGVTQSAVWTGSVRALSSPIVSGGTVVASLSSGGTDTTIARFDAGTLSRNGVAFGGDRIFWAFDNSGNNTLTSQGEDMFLNGIDSLLVPEPGSLALLGLGGLCVLRRRRS